LYKANHWGVSLSASPRPTGPPSPFGEGKKVGEQWRAWNLSEPVEGISYA